MNHSRGRASIAALALIVGLAVSPSGAASRDAVAVNCGDDGHAAVNAAAAARGDEPREPELTEPVEPLPASANGKGGLKFRASTPVQFHVVSPDGVVGNVTQAQIDDQIAVLNQAFTGRLGGANAGFTFRLAAVTRTVNADWYYAGPGSPDERAMKKALTQGAPQALNYYSTTAGPYLGWAYLPGLTPSRMYLDGIVVDWESMVHTSDRYLDRYDLGYTAVHEAGHWLGLLHTFDGGCNAHGDYVLDTPPMKVPTRGCPSGKDTCPEPGLDSIHNFMDYSYDACYFEFTAGQGARMQDHFLFFRAQ